MNKIIIASLPTVSLSKLKIIHMLYLEFYQNNSFSDTPPETTNNNPLFILENGIVYLLNHLTNPNFDLLKDTVISDIVDMSQNYYEIISNDHFITDNNLFNFEINETLITHELEQILNDMYIINDVYCKDKKIISVELVSPDRVYIGVAE